MNLILKKKTRNEYITINTVLECKFDAVFFMK